MDNTIVSPGPALTPQLAESERPPLVLLSGPNAGQNEREVGCGVAAVGPGVGVTEVGTAEGRALGAGEGAVGLVVGALVPSAVGAAEGDVGAGEGAPVAMAAPATIAVPVQNCEERQPSIIK